RASATPTADCPTCWLGWQLRPAPVPRPDRPRWPVQGHARPAWKPLGWAAQSHQGFPGPRRLPRARPHPASQKRPLRRALVRRPRPAPEHPAEPAVPRAPQGAGAVRKTPTAQNRLRHRSPPPKRRRQLPILPWCRAACSGCRWMRRPCWQRSHRRQSQAPTRVEPAPRSTTPPRALLATTAARARCHSHAASVALRTLLRRTVLECFDALAKNGASTSQARRHGAGRQLEQPGDLGHGHFFERVQHEDAAQLVAEAAEHRVQELAELLALSELVRLQGWRPRRMRVFLQLLAFAGQAAPGVRGNMGSRTKQESALAPKTNVVESPVGNDVDALNTVV